jgi:hypothetical protein
VHTTRVRDGPDIRTPRATSGALPCMPALQAHALLHKLLGCGIALHNTHGLPGAIDYYRCFPSQASAFWPAAYFWRLHTLHNTHLCWDRD